MVDGRIALGMVARATSGNRRGGQKRQVGIGRRVWCGGGGGGGGGGVVVWCWQAGRVAALSRAS
jgi:hypothetical protein